MWEVGVLIAECVLGKLPYKNYRMMSPFEKSKEKIERKLENFVDSCLVHDPLKRPSIDSLLNLKFLQDDDQDMSEVGLMMLRRLGDVSGGDTKIIINRDRLHCDKCGEDSGYSKVFKHEDGSRFLCDECLEAGHQECHQSLSQCQDCSSLGKIFRERWRRQESLANLVNNEDEEAEEVNNNEDAKPSAHVLAEETFEKPSNQVVFPSEPFQFTPDKLLRCLQCGSEDKVENGIVLKSGEFSCSSCVQQLNSFSL